MGKGRDVARSNAHTAMPASETTTLLPEKRGVESEAPCKETSCTKLKGKLPGEQPASQPSEENPARHRAGERQHPPGRRSRPNPDGANGNRARRRRAKTHFSSVRVPPKQDPPEARTVKCGTYIATEQNGLPKEAQSHPEAKPDRS